jgi:alkylresorcinol/alkylpyrone synthase
MTKIAGVASALPQYKYDQRVLLAALQKHWGPKLDNPVFVERLQARVGVETRYLALPIQEYYGLTWGAANNHWIEVAQDLGQKALCCALSRSGFSTDDLGAIFFVSVTGIASPSIDARLVNRMKLPVNIKRVPIFGLGCVAGAAGISRAADYVLAYPIISSGLFGDGAAAVLVSGAERTADGPEILATRSVFYPNSEHVMGWDISEKGFRIVLSREVPEVVHDHLASDVDAFLEEQGLSRADIGAWVLHTGGPRVLEATAAALDLPEGALAASWDCLKRTGNLSSASVLLVLEEVMTHRRPAPGTYSILAAMGPGFCSELVLLRW